jgi:hypothetical protein
VLAAGPPFSAAYALCACAWARARLAARIGFALAAVESLALLALIVSDWLQGDAP